MGKGVVVTGIGIISPIATGRDSYWDALLQGRTGFSPITLFDTAPFNVHTGGEIPGFDPALFLGKKGLRDLDRSTRLACSAASLAIDDAHLQISGENTHFTGVVIGTTFGSLHSISQFDLQGLREGPRYVNPSHFPNTVINSPASRVSIRFQIKGFNTTLSTGFCASLDAVCYASDFIRAGRAHTVLAGGVEELCEETFLGFYLLGYLSGSDGSAPVCCPFDLRRNGVVLSEGAGILVLEDSEHALRRGAEILVSVKGYGNSFDASTDRDFSKSGSGLEEAIKIALREASLAPEEIDYISSSANSTKGLDRMETKVVKQVFGAHASALPVSSIKSMVGESFSASGSLSVAAAVGALRKGFIPPTINYRERDEECDLDYVPDARQGNVENVLVLSSDPYGNNTAIILGRYER
jgi:3-oxoacyl-[acyl-carrier-protein] synthase II